MLITLSKPESDSMALVRRVCRSIGFCRNTASRKAGTHAEEIVSTARTNLDTVAKDMDLYSISHFTILQPERTYPTCVVSLEQEAIIRDHRLLTQPRSQSGMDCFEPSDAGEEDLRLSEVHVVS